MKTILLIITLINTISLSNVIELNGYITPEELKYIYHYGGDGSICITKNEIFVGGKKYNYIIEPGKRLVRKFCGISNIKTGAVSLCSDDSLLVAHSFNPENGYYYLQILNRKGELISNSIKHHPGTGNLFFNQADSTIVISGLHFTRYCEMLDKYDEESFTPSKQSKRGINNFFSSNMAYTLTKYDFNLTLIDSANPIERRGQNYRGYSNLYLHEVFDMDTLNNIYTIHNSSNYLIRKYSYNFELLFEFNAENENFIHIPDKLTGAKGNRMFNIPGTYSLIYTLKYIKNMIFISFYQNTNGWERSYGPFYYDLYTNDGDVIATGRLPYKVVSKDNLGNLYLLVKQNAKNIFYDDKYYLISITVNELLQNEISKSSLEREIDEYMGAY